MEPDTLEHIAREMKAAQDGATLIAPFTGRVPGFDHAAAYEAARLLHAMRVRAGWKPIGRKIGFTNFNIWPEYGVYAPIWGNMYESTVAYAVGQRATVRIVHLAQPRIEPEIAFRFKAAPPLSEDPEEILACVDWIAHGFEVVQSNFPDWKFAAADTIAQNGLHGHYLIGTPTRIDELGPDLVAKLRSFTITLSCNGELRDRGGGANVLGSPLAAIAHLLKVLAEQPQMPPLAAGEIVTTGTLTRALPIRAGETWRTTLDGIDLPGLTATFSK
jgi:2-oxo-3-hexenedioate decarboxylase